MTIVTHCLMLARLLPQTKLLFPPWQKPPNQLANKSIWRKGIHYLLQTNPNLNGVIYKCKKSQELLAFIHSLPLPLLVCCNVPIILVSLMLSPTATINKRKRGSLQFNVLIFNGKIKYLLHSNFNLSSSTFLARICWPKIVSLLI